MQAIDDDYRTRISWLVAVTFQQISTKSNRLLFVFRQHFFQSSHANYYFFHRAAEIWWDHDIIDSS